MTSPAPMDLNDNVLEGNTYNAQSPRNIGWYTSVFPEERYMKYVTTYMSVAQAIIDGEVDSLAETELAFLMWAAEDAEAIDAGRAMMEVDLEPGGLADIHDSIFGNSDLVLPGTEGLNIPKIKTGDPKAYQAEMGAAIFSDADYQSNFTGPHAKHSKQLAVFNIVDSLTREVRGGMDSVSDLMGTGDGEPTEIEDFGGTDVSQQQLWSALGRDSHGPTSKMAGVRQTTSDILRMGTDLMMFKAVGGPGLAAAKTGVNAAKGAGARTQFGKYLSQTLDKVRYDPTKGHGNVQRAARLGKHPVRRGAQVVGIAGGTVNIARQILEATQFNPQTSNYIDDATYGTMNELVGEENMRRLLGTGYRSPEERESWGEDQKLRYAEYEARKGGQ